MKIGEPPSEPLLAPRATCTTLHLEGAGEPDPSLVGSCGIALWRATIEQDRNGLDRSWTPALAYLHGVTVPLSRSCCEARAGNRPRALRLDRFAAPTPPLVRRAAGASRTSR
jgi:hypothetical protein